MSESEGPWLSQKASGNEIEFVSDGYQTEKRRRMLPVACPNDIGLEIIIILTKAEQIEI